MAKLTTITIETDSLLVLREATPVCAWCPQCRSEVEMIPLNEMGVVSNLPPAEVQAWLQSPELHHAAAADGASLICLNSMLKRIRRTREGESEFSADDLLKQAKPINPKEES